MGFFVVLIVRRLGWFRIQGIGESLDLARHDGPFLEGLLVLGIPNLVRSGCRKVGTGAKVWIGNGVRQGLCLLGPSLVFHGDRVDNVFQGDRLLADRFFLFLLLLLFLFDLRVHLVLFFGLGKFLFDGVLYRGGFVLLGASLGNDFVHGPPGFLRLGLPFLVANGFSSFSALGQLVLQSRLALFQLGLVPDFGLFFGLLFRQDLGVFFFLSSVFLALLEFQLSFLLFLLQLIGLLDSPGLFFFSGLGGFFFCLGHFGLRLGHEFVDFCHCLCDLDLGGQL
mmetsp:Transcript_7518/g.21949  ORF Transcript_7518/g.21949 Transcript_7518/m.21949 type:complete len:280 (-) Transcript_7518:535-1374(-)